MAHDSENSADVVIVGRGCCGGSCISMRRRSRGHLQRIPCRSPTSNLQTRKQLANKLQGERPSLATASRATRRRDSWPAAGGQPRARARSTSARCCRRNPCHPGPEPSRRAVSAAAPALAHLSADLPGRSPEGAGRETRSSCGPETSLPPLGATRSATVGSLGGRNPLSGLGIQMGLPGGGMELPDVIQLHKRGRICRTWARRCWVANCGGSATTGSGPGATRTGRHRRSSRSLGSRNRSRAADQKVLFETRSCTFHLVADGTETLTVSVLAPHPGKPEEVRALAKTLLQSHASLRPGPAAGTLTVQLPPMATQAQGEAVASLCAELNRSATLPPRTSTGRSNATGLDECGDRLAYVNDMNSDAPFTYLTCKGS